MKQQKISTIVPLYYGNKYIDKILKQIEDAASLLTEEYSMELVFVNDSPECPLKMVESEKIEVVYAVPEKNLGVHGARVYGLQRSRGEYILFFDQDDEIDKKYFVKQLQVIGDADAVICKAYEGEREFYKNSEKFYNMMKKEFIFGEWNKIISPGQVLLKKDAIPEAWMQNIMQYNGADDYFLWINMVLNEKKFCFSDEVLYRHVLHGNNASKNSLEMLQSEYEVIKQCIDLGISKEDLKLLLNGEMRKRTRQIKKLENMQKVDSLWKKWAKLNDRGIKIGDYLISIGINEIVIYGAGASGEHLYYEIKDCVHIKYFVDRNSQRKMLDKTSILLPEESLYEGETIVIAMFLGYEKLKKQLEEKGACVLVLTEMIEKLADKIYD